MRSVIESAARDSFISGMHLASLVAAAVLLLAAFGVIRWLPARAHDDVRAQPGPPVGERRRRRRPPAPAGDRRGRDRGAGGGPGRRAPLGV